MGLSVRLRILGVIGAMAVLAIAAVTAPVMLTGPLLAEMTSESAADLRVAQEHLGLSQSLFDQESAVRRFRDQGALLSRNTFNEALAGERRHYDNLVELRASGVALGGELDDVRAAAEDWRGRYAYPVLNYPEAAPLQGLGDELFSRVRERMDSLVVPNRDQTLFERAEAIESLRMSVLWSTVAIVLVVLAIAALALNRWIGTPLRQLVGIARRVESGEDISFPALGRHEIGDLAGALERMRVTIVRGQAIVGHSAARSAVLSRFTEVTALLEADRDVAEATLSALRQLVAPDAAVIHIANRSRDRATPEVTQGDAPAEVLTLHAMAGCPGVRRGAPSITPDVSEELAIRCPVFAVAQGTVACMPLVVNGESVGVVHLHWECIDALPLEAHGAIERIVEHSALAIGNRRLVKALQGMAATDGRTGLPNSRAFDDALESALRARIGDEQVAVLFLDLDHFKALNDAHGHPAGDEALRTFAGILRASVRENDIAARYGGEEFAVLLPATDAEMARTIAERIRGRTEATIATLGPGVTARMTVSIGVAVAPLDGLDAIGLLRTADVALYAAKQGGRNRVVASPAAGDDPIDQVAARA
jgi:diguanylate cyclase (GGDEF)-like protein